MTMITFISSQHRRSIFTMRSWNMKNEAQVGDLVMRGALLMLVIEIGTGYHQGFALCQGVAPFKGEYWIMRSLLQPV